MTNEEELENMCTSLEGTEIIVGSGHDGKVEMRPDTRQPFTICDTSTLMSI